MKTTNRNIRRVRTTWGKWKSLQGLVAESYTNEAVARKATDDTEIIVHKEVTPFGTFTHAIEWSIKSIQEKEQK